MINQIKLKYSTCNENLCHIEFFSSFYLNDILNGKCSASTSFVNATCLIENVNSVKIDFVAIDECLIDSLLIKKCDALVTKDNVIWFVELKEITSSSNRKVYSRRKNNARKKAVKQIASTINDFKSKGVDFSNFVVAGLISFPPFSPIQMPSSIPSTSKQARVLEFINLCGFSNLYEGNYIVL